MLLYSETAPETCSEKKGVLKFSLGVLGKIPMAEFVFSEAAGY